MYPIEKPLPTRALKLWGDSWPFKKLIWQNANWDAKRANIQREKFMKDSMMLVNEGLVLKWFEFSMTFSGCHSFIFENIRLLTWESGTTLTTFLHVNYKQQQKEWGGKSRNSNSWEANSALFSKCQFAALMLTETCSGGCTTQINEINVYCYKGLLMSCICGKEKAYLLQDPRN